MDQGCQQEFGGVEIGHADEQAEEDLPFARLLALFPHKHGTQQQRHQEGINEELGFQSGISQLFEDFGHGIGHTAGQEHQDHLLRGIHKGMKKFASFSMILLYVFMAIMIFCAPSSTFANGVDALGSFFSDFFYNNIYDGRSVQKDWTVYYWIWWISWAAFTAPFIVTISKGRTISSVVFYTVVVPSIFITIYMVVGNSIGMELLNKGNAITELPYLAIKKYSFIPPVFILLMSLFYVTSADSMSFAMDNIISKGSKIPVVYRKIMWVLLEVLFVTVLLLVGSGTTSAVQGLSFLFVPFMILIAIIFVVYIAMFYFKKFQTKE